MRKTAGKNSTKKLTSGTRRITLEKDQAKKDKRGGARPGAGRPPVALIPGLRNSSLHEIISVCQSSGVSRLKFNGLEIDFVPTRPQVATDQVSAVTSPDPAVRLQNQEIIAELEANQQMIDDPMAYEQGIIDEHLRGEGGTPTTGLGET